MDEVNRAEHAIQTPFLCRLLNSIGGRKSKIRYLRQW